MILFQIYFEVADENSRRFEDTYAQVFEPALRRQAGFQTSKLLRVYPKTRIDEIEGRPTEFNYQVSFVFDAEQSRRHWAKSPDHDVAWPQMNDLAKRVAWCGYDIVKNTD